MTGGIEGRPEHRRQKSSRNLIKTLGKLDRRRIKMTVEHLSNRSNNNKKTELLKNEKTRKKKIICVHKLRTVSRMETLVGNVAQSLVPDENKVQRHKWR